MGLSSIFVSLKQESLTVGIKFAPETELMIDMGAHRTFGLSLADGRTWGLCSLDRDSSKLLVRLSHVMQLQPVEISCCHKTLLLKSDGSGSRKKLLRVELPATPEGPVKCFISPTDDQELQVIQMMQLSQLIAYLTWDHGGVLLHSALAERSGQGVLMAGRSMVGKSTASSRLIPPWRALCDDNALAIRDPKGRYMAHPWPTWSRFLWGGTGGSWEVSRALPIRGIFILEQGQEMIEILGKGTASCLLTDCANQVAVQVRLLLTPREARISNLLIFDNICDLVNKVPAFTLHQSLTGRFWEEMEAALDMRQ
ncbi:Uncharacterised protein [uncultured archaeon]|nr:Uncharacterised protein [uncultured archaeon]